jgi:hypothetical protein
MSGTDDFPQRTQAGGDFISIWNSPNEMRQCLV